MNSSVWEAISARPVIAAVRTGQQLERAIVSPVAAVFLLGGSILDLPERVTMLRAAGKLAFVHLDLCEGLGRDAAAVAWCARAARPDGVISTRSQLLSVAAGLKLCTIQRVFLMDSSSLESGIRVIKANPPDMVELLPGVIPKAARRACAELKLPIIAGGMVTEAEEVKAMLAAGALAVSTSEEALWAQQ